MTTSKSKTNGNVKIWIVLAMLFLTLLSTTVFGAIKLEPATQDSAIKLNPDTNLTLELVLDTDTYKVGEEILGWTIFRIDDIAVASKEFFIEIKKGDTTIEEFRTTKTYVKTNIGKEGIYTISITTNYKGRDITTSQKVIIYNEQEETTTPTNINKTAITIDVNETQKVNLNSNVTIKGSINLDKTTLENIPENIKIKLFIYKKGSEDITFCPVNIETNTEKTSTQPFECTLNAPIQLGTHILEASLDGKLTTTKTINLEIEDNNELPIETTITGNTIFEPITIKTTLEKESNIAIKIISPTNKETYKYATQKEYKIDFIPQEEGIHKIIIEATQENKYTKKEYQIDVKPSKDQFTINAIQKSFENNSIKFNINLPNINRTKENNLLINITTPEEGIFAECNYIIQPSEKEFNVSCPNLNGLILGNYEATATININNETLTTRTNFKISIDTSNVTIINNVSRYIPQTIRLFVNEENITKVYGSLLGNEEIKNLIFTKVSNNIYEAQTTLTEKTYQVQINTLKGTEISTTLLKLNTIFPKQEINLTTREYIRYSNNSILISTNSAYSNISAKIIGTQEYKEVEFNKLEENIFVKDIILNDPEYKIIVTASLENITIKEEFIINTTDKSQTIQTPAKINKPVKWTAKRSGNNINIPILATNITIKDEYNNIIATGKDIVEEKTKLTPEEIINKSKEINKKQQEIKKLTKEKIVLDSERGKFITKLFASNNIEKAKDEVQEIEEKIKEIIPDNKINPEQTITITNLENNINTHKEVIVEYTTPAPIKSEKTISENKKQVIVQSDLHYQNITTESTITPTKEDKIKLYWYTNNTKTDVTNNKEVNLRKIDSDNDGLIDKLVWNTPHTSTQVFEIEIIIPRNINIENNEVINNKLWLISAKINTTGTLKIGNIKGIYATQVVCDNYNFYKSNLNLTEINNIDQYISEEENTPTKSIYNNITNSTYENWNCPTDTIIAFTLHEPENIEKENPYIKLESEIEYLNLYDNNLQINLLYNKNDLTNTSIKDVNITITTAINNTDINSDKIEIELTSLDDSKEIRTFTNITGPLTFAINKEENLFKEIKIKAVKDNTTKVETIIISPKIENNIKIGENVEFNIANIINATILDAEQNTADFTLQITETKITAIPNTNIKPGLYQIIINHENYIQRIWFTYGLLASNTDKPIYHINEPTKIEIVVLDNKGYIVKDADISIRIKRPDGFLEILSTDSKAIKLTESGSYEATYFLDNLGTYPITITATTSDKTLVLEKEINVVENYDFDIIRNSKTTIDPWNEDFKTEFEIKPFINIEEYEFIEKIPKVFNITETDADKIEEDNIYKYLIWNSPKKAFYVAATPKITPYLYTIGEAQIKYGGILGFNKEVYKENRTWMLAIDPVSQGNAMLFSASGYHNAEIQYSPRYRIYNPSTSTLGSTQSDMPDAPAAGLNHPTWIETARHPFKKEVITVWETNEGGPQRVYGSIWNGTSWGSLITFSADTGTNYKAFDVAYESDSGDAIVVYAVTGSNIPRYRIWNGTSWTAESNAGNIGSTPRFIELVSNPNINSDEIILATSDAAADVNVQVWNGNSWGGVSELTNNCWNNYKCFDIAYESQSGDALIAYRHDASTNFYYNTYSGGTWSGRGSQGGLSAQPRTIQLASDPTSNRIIIGVSDDASQNFHSAMWSGSGWTYMGLLSGSVNYENTIPFDLAFERNSGDAMIVYGEGSSMRYRTVAAGTTTLSGEGTVGSWGWTISGVRLENSEFTNTLYLSGMTAYYDIGFGIWDGAGTWSDTGLAIGGGLDTTHRIYRMLASTEYFNTEAPTPNQFGLNITNGAYLRRNAQVLAYSEWDDADRGLQNPAYITHNANGTSTEFNIVPTGQWANYTLDTSDFVEYPNVGRVDVENIRATDFGQFGETGYIGWFFILDESNLTSITRSQAIANQDETFSISCKVMDKDKSEQIEDYTVFFYQNETYLGNRRTNSTGWATYSYSISDVGNYKINCSISNNTYYIANTAENKLSTTVRVIDSTAPTVILNDPTNNTQDIDGNVIFNYTVNDESSGISSCSLLINGSVNANDNTIVEGINTFPVILGNGKYEWSINCTDDSSNANEGISEKRIITISPDYDAPTIQLIEPPNGADTLSSTILKFNATDKLSDVDECRVILDGIANETVFPNFDGEVQEVTLNGLSSGLHTWRVNCSDDSTQNNWVYSTWYSFNVGQDNTPPDMTILFPTNGHKNTNGNINIIFSVNDYMSGIDNCRLYVNGALNQTNNSVNESYTQVFTLTGLTEASYDFYISCTDDSSNSNWANTESRTFTVDYDFDSPTIELIIPENNYQSVTGNVVFTYNVTDENEIKNCSLLINGSINSTDTTITKNTDQTFNVNGFATDKYTWNIECYDNSDDNNYNTATARNFSVGPDTIGPEITLIAPSNNGIDTDGDILFTYITNDVTSGIATCEVFVNGSSVDVDNTVTENTYQFLTGTLVDGRYEWYMRCIDDSPQANIATSATQYFNVSVNFETQYNLELEDHYVAQGEIINPNASLLDSYNNPLDNGNAYAYIIRNLGTDNQTTGWWDNSWTRRIEIPITNTGTNSYTNAIVPITLNTQSLISAGLLRNDCADLRFAGQGGEPLNYYFWNADNDCNNAATDILIEMTNIWDSNIHRIGSYFNNAGATVSTAGHNNYLIADNFDNGNTFTNGYWIEGSSTPLGGVTITNAKSDDGANSAQLLIDCTGNACDWALETTSFEKTITVTEDSTLTWRWDRDGGSSTLRFYLDGTPTDTSGTAWGTATETISAGTHTIKWEYRTTATGIGNQLAYVDQIRIQSNNINVGTATTQSEPVTQLTTQATDLNGFAEFNWNTAGQPYGNYAITGFGTKSSYWSDYSGYNFKIGPDIEEPIFSSWGLNVTDGTIVRRGQKILAYSYWIDKVNLSTAWLEHNGTGISVNHSITPFNKALISYANYTLDTSNLAEFSQIGRINVNTIYANDTSDNWNKTTPPKYFILTSNAEISNSNVNQTILIEDRNYTMRCQVTDEYTSANIANYDVSFFYNNNLIGTAKTDGTGWAQINAVANIPGDNVEIRCSITNDLSLYYYAGTQNSESLYINVTDIAPPVVNLYYPQNNTLKIFPNLAMGFSAEDSGQLDQCDLYGSWGGWHIEQTIENPDNGAFPVLNYFNPIMFPQGIFYWYVSCNDSKSNVGNSSIFTFNVSLSAPEVTLYAPPNNQTIAAGPAVLEFSANQPEAEVGIMNCTLAFNGTLNDTLIGPLVKTQIYNFTVPQINYGLYNWSVTCYANNTLSASDWRLLRVIQLDMENITGIKTIDRDNISSSIPDKITIITKEITGTQNRNVTFFMNITDPIIAGQNNIYIGWNITNASGYAQLTFNPNSSIYAGNYTVWTSFDNWSYSKSIDTDWFEIYGGLNVSFISANNPNNHYYYGELLNFETDVNSLGPEDNNNLAIDYNIITQAMLESPFRTKETNITLPYVTNNWTNSISSKNIYEHGIWNVNLTLNNSNYFLINNLENRTFYMNLTTYGVPNITRIQPLNNFATANPTITFEWTTYDALENNMWCNLTIDGINNVTNIPVTNATPYLTNVPNFSEGAHNWRVTCWDYANNTNTTTTWNFTLDLTNPKVNFTTPTDYNNFVTLRNWTLINVTVTELNLDTVTLEWNGVNETMPCTGTSPNYFCEVNKTNIADGNYSYIVYANDTLTNDNKTENRYIGIDTTNPLVIYNAATLTNTSSTNNNWLYVRIDVTEPYLDTALLEWNGINETMTCAGVAPNRFCFVNKTILPDGAYTFKTYANDTLSHKNSTEYWINYIDTTRPKINFTTPTEITNLIVDRNWTYINVTVNETTLANVTLEWNGVNESMSCIGSSPNYFCEINKTNIIDGNYSYQVFANDSLSNTNKTEIRYIGIDTTNPQVVYNGLTLPNATATNKNWLYVRIDITESYLDTAILEWNGINETMTCAGAAPNRFCFVNKTTLSDGAYTFKTYVNDSLNHKNSTEYWINYLDTTRPKINFTAPTNATNTIIGYNWTLINVTVNETTLANVTLEWNGVNESMSCTGSSPDYFCEINKTNIIDGNYSYQVFANDSLSNTNKTETRYIAIDTTNPQVVYNGLTLPNTTATNNNWLFVRTDVIEPYLDTALLEWNGINETMTCAGAAPNRFCYINKTALSDGTYNFKIYVNDSLSHKNSTEYRINYVDSTVPKINFTNPTVNTNTIIPVNWTYINVTINETTPENITLQWNGTNESLTCIGTSPDYYCGINKTNLVDGNYSFKVYVNDSVGNSNQTETRYVYIDTTAPQIYFVPPTPNNNNISYVNWTFVEVSKTEYNPANTTINWNGTYYEMSCAGTRPSYNCWINITDLSDGNYTYQVCANDTNNLINCTEERNITIFRLFYILDINLDLKAVLTNNASINAASEGLNGIQHITLQTAGGMNISNFTVNFYKDHNWSNISANINTTTGISYIHVPSGHDEISTNKTLFIPVKIDLGAAYICPDAQDETQVSRSCSNIEYRWGLVNESGFYKVNITGTGGQEGTLANLTIFDDTNDFPLGENRTHIVNENIDFYANFSNATNTPINDTNGVDCEITFNITGGWTAPQAMTFNSGNELWTYQRSFSNAGTYDYNITCNGTRQAYDVITTSDNFTLVTTVIYFNNISATPNYAVRNTPILITANVTSPVNISQAWLNITGPTGNFFIRMNNISEIYNYTFTNTANYGIYTYNIWANDSFGNSDISTNHTFEIVRINSVNYIYTENDTYGINEIVNLKNESTLNDWWNYAWNKRRAILFSENKGIERINEIVTINITDLNLTNNCDELRIVSKWSGTPIENPYQLLSNGTNWCEVLFMANISADATNEELYSAYFENPTAPAPSYTDQVVLSTHGGEANHQISATDYLIQFEPTNDLPETFISRVGTYQQDIIDEWSGCNGAGMITDTSASWRDECNDAGVVTLVEDGPLRSIITINKTATNTMDYINKTYTFYPTYFTIEVVVQGGGTGNINNNQVSFIRVNHAAQTGEPFRLFNFETSTGSDPDLIECSGGHELVGGWSSDWASIFRSGFDSAYSSQVVSDPFTSLNTYEYYEGGVECGASSKQDFDIDNNEISGPVTLGFIPHGEETTNLFGQEDSLKIKNPVSYTLDVEKTADETYSVIINTGEIAFNGSVVMTIEYFNETISDWQYIDTIINDSVTSTIRTLNPNDKINTGNLWNLISWNTTTSPAGLYRATQTLVNNTGQIILNQDGSSISNNYEFEIYYEYASVNQSYLTNNNILDNEIAEMNCQIIDPVSNLAQEGYTVSFFKNGTFMGTNTTNSTGFAVYKWNENIGKYFIVCNITDDTSNSKYTTPPIDGSDILTVWPAGADTEKPVITNVIDSPDPANISDTITITADVTDNKNVSLVQVMIRRPGEDTWTAFNMTHTTIASNGNGSYEYNYTLTNMGGYFTYYIYAEDNWTSPNWQRSSYYRFFIEVVKGITKIKTEYTNYKGLQDVLIDSYTTYQTTDVELGSQSTSMQYVFFSNGFEDSSGTGEAGINNLIWNYNNGDGNDIDITNSQVNSGTYAIHLQDGNPQSWIETVDNSINLSGQTSCNISIARRVDSMEGVDDWASLDIFDGSWNNGLGVWGPPQSGSGWATENYNLDNYNYVDDFKIRMKMTATADDDEAYFDDIQITCENEDLSNNFIDYNTGGVATNNISYIELKIQVDEYDSRGSTTTTEPDIQVGIWDGTAYKYNNYCELDRIYNSNALTTASRNCTIIIDDEATIAAWENPANRNIKVRGTYLDANSNGIDSISWSGIWTTFVTPSIIANTGSQEIKGRILLQVYNNDTNELVHTVYNQSYNISVGEKINTSNIWNTNPFNTNYYPLGTYYAYSAVVNNVGAIIQNPSGSFIEDKSYFDLRYLAINITFPIQNGTYYEDNLTLNVTLNNTYYSSGGWCGYSLDGQPNQSMTQINAINFTTLMTPLSGGNHSVIVYCNDTDGDISRSENITFYVDKDTVSIVYPTTELILDRDEMQPTINDSVKFHVRTGEVSAGINVSYYIKPIEPTTTYNNHSIYLGYNLTNTSGESTFNFNPNSSIYASNYSWWGTISGGTLVENGSILIYGTLNSNFTNANSQPDANYLKTENILINATVASYGIENFTILNSTYNLTRFYNITSPVETKVYDNLTQDGNYFTGNYFIKQTDSIGRWNATIISNAKYFFVQNVTRNISVANKVSVVGKLNYNEINTPNIMFNLTVTNRANATVNTSAFIYVPANYQLTGINETSDMRILSGGYDGRSYRVNLTLSEYQTRIIEYNATLTYNASRKMQEAIMFGIDPR